MSIVALRFASGLSGEERQYELHQLRTRGVISLKPVFPGDFQRARVGIYVIGLGEGVSMDAVQDYVQESKTLVGLSNAELETIKLNDEPEPMDPRSSPVASRTVRASA